MIRRLNKGKDWFSADFVDGDAIDEFDWCEGPFHQQMSVRELFGKKHKYDRHIRRRITGRKKVALGESSEDSDDDSSPSDDEKGTDESSESESNGDDEKSNSDGTDEYVASGSSRQRRGSERDRQS